MSWLDRFTKPFRKPEKVEAVSDSIAPLETASQPLSLPVTSQSAIAVLEEDKAIVLSDQSEYEIEPEQEPDEKPENNYLTDREKKQVCQLLAMFRTTSEIQKYVKRNFGKEMQESTLRQEYRNSQKWQLVIQQYRRKYQNKIEEIPLANKIKRIEKLQRQFEHLEEIAAKNASAKKKVAVMRDQRQVLAQMQDEVEGKGAKVFINDNSVSYKFSQMKIDEFEKYRLDLAERVERLKRKQIVEVDAIAS